MRESVRVSNIKIILFAKLFLAPQMQASGGPPSAPGAGPGPSGPDLHLELGGPLSRFADVQVYMRILS